MVKLLAEHDGHLFLLTQITLCQVRFFRRTSSLNAATQGNAMARQPTLHPLQPAP